MTTPTVTDQLLAGLVEQFSRIADALERMAAANAPAPPPPDYVRGIGEFATFDWTSINAHVIETDEYGPSVVEFKGKAYKRRSPENKYDPVIYFSRAFKDENDAIAYERLITFKEFKPAEPLGRKAEASAAAAAAAQKPAPAGNGKAPAQPASNRAAKDEEDAARAAFLAGQQQGEKDFAGLKSASEEPAQAAALKAAAASHAAPDAPAGELPFKDQGTAVKWAVGFPHYQKPDGGPDYPHAVGSHADLCKRLNCSDKNLACWGQAWLQHVQERAGQ